MCDALKEVTNEEWHDSKIEQKSQSVEIQRIKQKMSWYSGGLAVINCFGLFLISMVLVWVKGWTETSEVTSRAVLLMGAKMELEAERAAERAQNLDALSMEMKARTVDRFTKNDAILLIQSVDKTRFADKELNELKHRQFEETIARLRAEIETIKKHIP